MSIDRELWATLLLTVVNILVLYFILKKVLFKPVTKFMDARSLQVEDALNMAEEAKAKVDKMEEEHKTKLKEIKEEGIVMMDSYKKKADNEYNTIIEKAKADAELMTQNARNELDVEKDRLMASIKEEVSDMVLEASEKVLGKNLDNKANRELISDFIKEKN